MMRHSPAIRQEFSQARNADIFRDPGVQFEDSCAWETQRMINRLWRIAARHHRPRPAPHALGRVSRMATEARSRPGAGWEVTMTNVLQLDTAGFKPTSRPLPTPSGTGWSTIRCSRWAPRPLADALPADRVEHNLGRVRAAAGRRGAAARRRAGRDRARHPLQRLLDGAQEHRGRRRAPPPPARGLDEGAGRRRARTRCAAARASSSCPRPARYPP